MAQTLVNVRMDEDLKKSFDTVCNELGMNMTTAIVIFAKKVSREKRIPFDVSIDPFYSESNMKALQESIEQLNSGKTVIKSLEELEDMANG
ncbi:MAG: type II toxin-antitoxin system RelB/DinJ family antitoxin [Acutalibacteraceae bacterium]|nr:type II toxin-antitoxin system RelB/DinJ family antitoxin [Bacillota bacterium]